MFSKLVSSGSKLWTEGVKNLVIRDKVSFIIYNLMMINGSLLLYYILPELAHDENYRRSDGQ